MVDPQGNTIASSSYHYDPENDVQVITQGEEVTTTWMNALGLPIAVQKGDILTTYEYDSCGNCVTIIDGEGRTTRQAYDGLRRMIQKELPDGALLAYAYDLDSNLIECHLPNGVIWKALYDSMGRKSFEELKAGRQSSQQWEFTYENGYLTQTKDPMQRIHAYLYDPHGRLVQENVDAWQRAYTYDARGLLSTAEQIGSQYSSWVSSWFYAPHPEHSKIERSYDADGRLIVENVYLNSSLIQQTNQSWGASSRSLQIEDHERDFIYQNNQLIQVSTANIDLSYTYNLSGSIENKITPLSTATTRYNAAGLPEDIRAMLPDGIYPEALAWHPSGKLSAYSSPAQQKQFTYTARGHLQSAGQEKYEFDFGAAGTGVRTAAPGWYVPQRGLDAFSKILTEISGKKFLTAYNPMGEAITHNQRQLEWDPWGKLLRVYDGAFTWEASYDAFGRRLQTRYTPANTPTLTMTSLYDPEQEFQEIGVKYAGKTFWKIYGPDACDAVTDETGAALVLMHNALGQLAGVVSSQGTVYSEQFPSSYGPQSAASIPSDLLSFAQSLSWHSQAQDPTGFIWMGARYYDPKGGRFLSPDPVGSPICLDLYSYANGDPVNYLDPDGRFSSLAYKKTPSTVIDALNHFGVGSLLVNSYNDLTSICANKGWTRTETYQVGSFDLPNGAIIWVNGINNERHDALEKASMLSQYAGGAKIHGVFNPSTKFFGRFGDVIGCIGGHLGFHSPGVRHIVNTWYNQSARCGPDAKFLTVCHSGGAIDVYNALRSVPEALRQQIIVLAIAPGEIIPRKLCFDSNNYISDRDFVSHLDFMGKLRYASQLQVLKAHPNAKGKDHEFSSLTFQDTIRGHITGYIKNGGKK